MRLSTLSLLLPAALALLGAEGSYAAAAKPVPAVTAEADSLPQGKIHDLYNGGDFEPVIGVLETWIRNHKTYSHSDSVFIAKHLAVVYSANPDTREKGKYYMFRLLELLPSAKLVDMYVSEEVDRIFDRVREEFRTRQHAFGVDTSRIHLPDRPRPDGTQPKPEAGSGKSHALAWSGVAAGCVAAIAAGAWIWYANGESETVPPKEPVKVTVTTPKN